MDQNEKDKILNRYRGKKRNQFEEIIIEEKIK